MSDAYATVHIPKLALPIHGMALASTGWCTVARIGVRLRFSYLWLGASMWTFGIHRCVLELYSCSYIFQIICMGAYSNTRVKDIGITHHKQPLDVICGLHTYTRIDWGDFQDFKILLTLLIKTSKCFIHAKFVIRYGLMASYRCLLSVH